jgi:hypothetical protein
VRRIHITGGPGTGKTTLAKALAERLGLAVHDLDGSGLDLQARMDPTDYEGLAAARRVQSQAFAANEAWISEGSNILVARPLFERAEVIVVLYTSWRVASYRILARHAKATLVGNNRFPGLRRLYRFWRWSARFYANTNPPGLNEWGTPTTQATMEDELAPYEAKVMRYRSKGQVLTLVTSLTDESHRRA